MIEAIKSSGSVGKPILPSERWVFRMETVNSANADRCNTEAEEILSRLGIRQVIEKVREEWQEGICKNTSCRRADFTEKTLSLTSEPFKSLSIHRNPHLRGNPWGIMVWNEQSVLSVTISHGPLHWPEENLPFEPPRLIVSDGPVFDLMNTALQSRRLSNFITGYDLKRDLEDALLFFYTSSHYRTEINPNAEDAVDRFNKTMNEYIARRAINASLPRQMREWSEDLINQIPHLGSAKDSFVRLSDLASWEGSISRHSKVLSLLRGLDYRFFRGY